MTLFLGVGTGFFLDVVDSTSILTLFRGFGDGVFEDVGVVTGGLLMSPFMSFEASAPAKFKFWA